MNRTRRLTLGTRGSKLALCQADAVAGALRAAFPDLSVAITVVKTQGDLRPADIPAGPSDMGLFTGELEKELSNGFLDIAVHSLKDLPSRLAPGLCLGAVLKRENPRDVLVSDRKHTLSGLPEGAVVGTASHRRAAQIKALRPDIIVVPVRGNIETRINKMREQDIAALVLAYAGIVRLGLEHMIAEIIPEQNILPSPGQGTIAVEARESDGAVLSMLATIEDRQTRFETSAERAFLHRLNAGCRVPVACMAQMQGDRLAVQGRIVSLDGAQMYAADISGSAREAETLGGELAEKLLLKGGAEILAQIRQGEAAQKTECNAWRGE